MLSVSIRLTIGGMVDGSKNYCSDFIKVASFDDVARELFGRFPTEGAGRVRLSQHNAGCIVIRSRARYGGDVPRSAVTPSASIELTVGLFNFGTITDRHVADLVAALKKKSPSLTVEGARAPSSICWGVTGTATAHDEDAVREIEGLLGA